MGALNAATKIITNEFSEQLDHKSTCNIHKCTYKCTYKWA